MSLDGIKKTLRAKAKYLLVLLTLGFMAGAPAAAEVNWSEISTLLDGIATYLIPSFVGLVTAAVPLLILMAVVGFVLGFMDGILGMLNKFR